MGRMRRTSLGVLLVCLAGCGSTQVRTTREFPAYFRTAPAGYLTSEHVYERARLEQVKSPSVWERKRLLDLYELEIKSLSPSSARFQSVAQAMQALTPYTQDLVDRLASAKEAAQRGVPEAAPKPSVFVNAEFKKLYFEAYRLWNKDENAAALEKAVAILANEKLLDSLEDAERIKLWNLTFRVALDTQDLGKAYDAWKWMHEQEDCSTQASEAGFLLAMTYFGLGDPKKSQEIFLAQCDPDGSAVNMLRRRYWTARLVEANGGTARAEFEAIAASGVPGYYYLLAHHRLKQGLKLESPAFRYRSRPMQVSSRVAESWALAEESLDHGLRPDAATYLARATEALLPGAGRAEVDALLYTAHLYQAAGVQLESMRIYAKIADIALEPGDRIVFDFLPEMFPLAHAQTLFPVAAHWKVDPDFAYAILRQESAFNPGAVSPVNARGLMQLMPLLGQQIAQAWRYPHYTKRSLFFARENIQMGVYHLAQLDKQFHHPALVAAAYNAGSKRVAAWWKRAAGAPLDVFIELIPILETRNYVKLVLRNQMFYKAVRSGGILSELPLGFEMPLIARNGL
ncbi:lytic transglycosylase domain-containing protein [bacterium]|nr:lytic transglycosylase domain-containing protein [bacterium]